MVRAMAPWTGYEGDLARLAMYGLGIAAYTLVVALLYVPLGTRMMFAKRRGEQAHATMGRRFLYVLTFPLLSFAFFLVVAGSMFFMGGLTDDGALEAADVMTIAMGVVLAIRVCAYFSETAAADLAKVMPLSMLAVVLVTNRVSGLDEALENLRAFRDEAALLALFFFVVVFAEFLLRLVYELLGRPNKGKAHA